MIQCFYEGHEVKPGKLRRSPDGTSLVEVIDVDTGEASAVDPARVQIVIDSVDDE